MVLAALVACACGRSANHAPAAAPQATTIVDAEGAMAALGTRVRVEGTAENDKISAVVSTGRLAVYCLDLSGWPVDQVGKPAAIEGTLERTDEFESRTKGGLVTQGTNGALFVIRRCTVVK